VDACIHQRYFVVVVLDSGPQGVCGVAESHLAQSLGVGLCLADLSVPVGVALADDLLCLSQLRPNFAKYWWLPVVLRLLRLFISHQQMFYLALEAR
jgi:hypothetical protein